MALLHSRLRNSGVDTLHTASHREVMPLARLGTAVQRDKLAKCVSASSVLLPSIPGPSKLVLEMALTETAPTLIWRDMVFVSTKRTAFIMVETLENFNAEQRHCFAER